MKSKKSLIILKISTLLINLSIIFGCLSLLTIKDLEAQLLPEYIVSLDPTQQEQNQAILDYYIQTNGQQQQLPLKSSSSNLLDNNYLLQKNVLIDEPQFISTNNYNPSIDSNLNLLDYLDSNDNNRQTFEREFDENIKPILSYYEQQQQPIENDNIVQSRANKNLKPLISMNDNSDGLAKDEIFLAQYDGLSEPINVPIDLLNSNDDNINFSADDNENEFLIKYNVDNKTSEQLNAISLSAYLDKVLNQFEKSKLQKNSLLTSSTDSINNDLNQSILNDLIFNTNDNGDVINSNSEQQQQQQRSINGNDDNLPSRYGNGGEYIDHPLALIGHQYVQGGAGEGRQLLGPEGTYENVQVIKSDRAVPSYCDPPNPCPIGYKAEDGCLENFVNSASFSREYQAKQKCSCDNEHSLFNCAAPNLKNQNNNNDITSMNNLIGGGGSNIENSDRQQQSLLNHKFTTTEQENNNINDVLSKNDDEDDNDSNKLDTLARSVMNRFGNLASVRNLINGNVDLNEKGFPLEGNINNNRIVHKRT